MQKNLPDTYLYFAPLSLQRGFCLCTAVQDYWLLVLRRDKWFGNYMTSYGLLICLMVYTITFNEKSFPPTFRSARNVQEHWPFVRVHQTQQTKEQQTEVWVCKSLQLPAPAATAALRPMTLAKSLQCHVIQSSRRTPDLFLIKENFWLFPQPIFFSISNSIVLDVYTFNIFYFLFLE